jgi:hypothetical protein
MTRWQPVTAWRRTFRIRWASAAAALLSLALAETAPARERGADGNFEKRVSSHFVLYQDVDIDESGGLRGSRRFEQQVLDELEGAYDRLDALLGLRPERRIDVVVYDQRVFDQGFAGRFQFQPAGFFNGVIHVRSADLMTVQLARVLHHELVHAAFEAAAPSLVLPGWMNEGFAEWFEARGLGKRRLSPAELDYLWQARQAGALLPLATLSAPAFGRLSQQQASLAYLQSYGMIEYLARRFGEGSLRELCDAVLRSRDVERSLLRVFRFGVLDLEAGFVSDLG